MKKKFFEFLFSVLAFVAYSSNGFSIMSFYEPEKPACLENEK